MSNAIKKLTRKQAQQAQALAVSYSIYLSEGRADPSKVLVYWPMLRDAQRHLGVELADDGYLADCIARAYQQLREAQATEAAA